MGITDQELQSVNYALKSEDNILADQNAENSKRSSLAWVKRYKWWIQMVVYSFLVLAGQSVGTLLGGVYFDKGGKSVWMATFVQVAGFPVLYPFQWFAKNKKVDPGFAVTRKPSYPLILASVYLCLGIFVAADCMLYSIGLQYLPVSTYTLICASQLGFNALFSCFLNRQKFTPYRGGARNKYNGNTKKESQKKYVIGFLSTLGASAGYGLMLPLTQLAFEKIIKKETLKAIIDMSIYQSVVATFVILIGLFSSGDWKTLNREMDEYESGKVSYLMNLFWTAVSWQAFSVGCIGLIFKISSLFSNVISIFGLPLAPIMSVIFLQDKLTGLKGVSMILALWGFVSYMYQHYLDDLESRKANETSDIEEVSVAERAE